jgi:hypothetical protein
MTGALAPFSYLFKDICLIIFSFSFSGLAYAMLAQIYAITGIYTAFFPVLVSVLLNSFFRHFMRGKIRWSVYMWKSFYPVRQGPQVTKDTCKMLLLCRPNSQYQSRWVKFTRSIHVHNNENKFDNLNYLCQCYKTFFLYLREVQKSSSSSYFYAFPIFKERRITTGDHLKGAPLA